MKPFKNASKFSNWLVRITLVAYLLIYYHSTLMLIDFLDATFLFALVYVMAAVLLLLGGFRKKHELTLYSSIILLFAIGFNVYLDIADGIFGVVRHLLPFSISFYFLAHGNK